MSGGWADRLATPVAMALCMALAIGNGVPLPFPIGIDLDSSFLAFLAMADERGWSAGGDFVFTYGPLGSWFMPIGIGVPLYCAAALRAASAAAVAIYIWSERPDVVSALLAAGSVYLVLTEANSALLSSSLVLALALPRRGLAFVCPLVALSVLWGLVKFTGLVAFALTLAAYAVGSLALEAGARLRVLLRLFVVAAVALATVAAVYLAVLDQPIAGFLRYAGWSMEISDGYASFMAGGWRPGLAVAFLAAAATTLLLQSLIGRDRRCRPAGRRVLGLDAPTAVALLCSAAVLFVVWKQGFTRQDGHEGGAFAVAFVHLSLVLASGVPAPRLTIPAWMTVAVIAVVANMSIRTGDVDRGTAALARRLSATPGRLVDSLALLSPAARAAATRRVEERDRAALLQPIDGRYPNLEDGSTLAQVILQFCPTAQSGAHLELHRTTPAVTLAALQALPWSSARLDEAGTVDLPPGMVLGRIDITLSTLGRAFAGLYRLPPVEAIVVLTDGSERRVRLIPTGRRHPAVLSPWLESVADLDALWSAGRDDAQPRAVRSIRLDTPSRTRMLIDAVTLDYASWHWPPVAERCRIQTE